jgi:hypothetical protein
MMDLTQVGWSSKRHRPEETGWLQFFLAHGIPERRGVADAQLVFSLAQGVAPYERFTWYQEQIEWHLRVASLLVGLAVGVMSLLAIVRKWRGRQNDDA